MDETTSWMFFHPCWFPGYHLQVQVFDAGDSRMCSHDCHLIHIKSSKYIPSIDRHVNPNHWFYDHHV